MTQNKTDTRPAHKGTGLRLLPGAAGDWAFAGDLFLQDRPGELAEVSSVIAAHEANIEQFHYNRSEDASLVRIRTRLATARAAGALAEALRARGYLTAPETSQEKSEITELGGLLRIKVTLEDRVSTLAAFASVLKAHHANVIFLSYDGEKTPGLVEMAMATRSPDEVGVLLQDLNQRGYHYHVEWQGANGASIDDVIGLSLVERFLLKLKTLLPKDKINKLRELLDSSEDLRETLLNFKRESGENEETMAASAVFSSILQLATSSISKTGRNFVLRVTGPLALTDAVSLYVLACPTGANGYLLRAGDDYALIDSSYGLYYPDVAARLPDHGIAPSRIRHGLFTHPDADHAGWAAPLEADFGTEIYMHPHSIEVLRRENRAYGSSSRLMALNGYYTKLINRFTDMRMPKGIRPFPAASGEAGGFRIIGRFQIGDVELLVLESYGGHVPAQVFFYSPRHGLLFCGDYLIDFRSLSERTKSTLSIARILMTSTNSDSGVFGREMIQLARLMLDTDARLRPLGRSARIFPGHGEFYSVEEADWLQGLVSGKADDENPVPKK